MRRIALAAATITGLLGAVPAHASVLALPFNCTSGTTCSTAATAVPGTLDTGFAQVRSVGCEWTAGTGVRVEVIVTAANGATAVQKVYFPLRAEEKTGRALTTSPMVDKLNNDWLGLEAGQLLKVTIVTSTAGANKGICYIDARN